MMRAMMKWAKGSKTADMHHTVSHVSGIEAAGLPERVVMLTLEQTRSTGEFNFRLRMTPEDAVKLADALVKASKENGIVEVPTA
jgi:hypothetical protein